MLGAALGVRDSAPDKTDIITAVVNQVIKSLVNNNLVFSEEICLELKMIYFSFPFPSKEN